MYSKTEAMNGKQNKRKMNPVLIAKIQKQKQKKFQIISKRE